MLLSLADFFPDTIPSLDNDDYSMLGGWAIAAGVLLSARHSVTPTSATRWLACIGFAFHTAALLAELADDYLPPDTPGVVIAIREIVELIYLGAYCCAAGLTISRVGLQAFSDPGARKSGLLVPPSLERRIGGWFKTASARKLRIAVEDARWRDWRRHNPGRSFGQYYAQEISRSLANGQPHRTLGVSAYSDSALLSGKGKWSREDFSQRGLRKFSELHDWGLRRDERVIDYGCGSLRVGQHLIRYLDAGNYTGLDVTDAFYRDGLKMLEPGLVEAKRPHLAIIDEALVSGLSLDPPDVLLSVAVVMHVPPDELDGFFRRILQLVGTHTRAMIHVDIADRELRTAPKSWAYPAEHFRNLIGSIVPDHEFCLTEGEIKGRMDGLQWRHAIITLQSAVSGQGQTKRRTV
jgi:SAM-dependent methyltransferase